MASRPRQTFPKIGGPPIEGLTEQMSEFVRQYVATGGQGAAAARSAGYAEKFAAVSANRLLAEEKIRAAIRDESQRWLEAGVAVAQNTLRDLAANAKTENVRLNAATALLDRGGMQLVMRTKVDHTHTIEHKTDKELLEGIKTLAKTLGLKDIRFDVVDADYKELADGEQRSPAQDVRALGRDEAAPGRELAGVLPTVRQAEAVPQPDEGEA